MDPLSQAVLGASAAQSSAKTTQSLFIVSVLGAIGGMAADLDVLIQSNEDPLLFLKFHRHFTHSLIFIPVGGLIIALLLYFWSRNYMSFFKSYLFVTLGYATHGLLDACTTYGTLLFWPFSDARIAWNNVSVIDPLFTIPVLIFVTLSVLRKKLFFGKLALAWSVFYLLLGLVQRDRAEAYAIQELAKQGHAYTHLSAKPTFGNLLLWKIVTRTADKFHVDAVRVGLKNKFYPGDKVNQLVLERDFPELPKDSLQAKDIERFRWFSDDYLALSENDPTLVVDVRYSMLPNRATGLWGIRINQKNPHTHVEFINFRDTSRSTIQQFFSMLLD